MIPIFDIFVNMPHYILKAKASSRWMHLKRRIPVEIVKADLQEPQVDTEAQSKIIEQLNVKNMIITFYFSLV